MINLPGHAPFGDEERKTIEALVAAWSAEQRAWVSGFLAGGASGQAGEPAGGAASGGGGKLTVLYGTESGNSEELADQVGKAARKQGFKVQIRNMAESKVEQLAEAERLLVIVSTWGEGDPPESAEDFHQGLMTGGPALGGIPFSVCALGDTSYDQFCETGKQVDRRLEELGGERVAARVDCDVDYEEAFAGWLEGALSALGATQPSGSSAGTGLTATAPAVSYGKKNPFPAELGDKVLLNGRGTAKETWHLELSLEGSGLVYEPGDSLAVVPSNAPDVVDDLLGVTGLRAEEEVELKGGGRKALREALMHDYDITALSRKVASAWQARSGAEELAGLLAEGNKEHFKSYLHGRQIVDLAVDFPAKGLQAQELVGMLRGLPPRLYSIASSPRACPGEVHLTVAAVRYATHGRSRKGVASTYLADQVGPGDSVPVFVTPNKRFRLPVDDGAPIIMVGPGTGVAPFRAFVQERAERGATGKNWLIFGDQHYLYDFLYQLEWQDHLKSGTLSRLDVAFSRDQPEKVYVQDRMREQARDLYAWLEEGATFYVCGDAVRMAPDVHAALIDVVAGEGGRSREEAEAYVEQLRKDGRYLRDVY